MANPTNTRYDYLGDPFNNDVISSGQYPRIQSLYYSGGYDNIIAPSSANYPVNTPTRYFVRLPVVPDTTDLSGSRPMSIYDVTSGIALTKVSSSPGTNQYAVAPAASRSNNVIEINASQAGKTIGFDYYGTGSFINATDYNSGQWSFYVTTSGVFSYKNIKNFVFEIGAWNMNSSTSVSIQYNANFTNPISLICGISTSIKSDSNRFYNGASNDTWGSVVVSDPHFTGTYFLCTLVTPAGSIYTSSPDFSSTGVNRGYVTINYI